MADLIDRQAAIEALDDNITLTGWGNSVAVRDYILRTKKRLQAIPAAQPERKTVKWNVYYHDYNDFSYSCNWCGYSAPYNLAGGVYKQKKWAFCPNCGARMEGVE